jgi:hypothetical protein
MPTINQKLSAAAAVAAAASAAALPSSPSPSSTTKLYLKALMHKDQVLYSTVSTCQLSTFF